MIATGVVTPFLVPVKVVLLVALVLTLPYLLYQAWAFIAPGLYQHEKRLVLPLVLASTVLFMVGMAFCYFFVFRRGVQVRLLDRAEEHLGRAGHRELLQLRHRDVPRLRGHLRGPDRRDRAGEDGDRIGCQAARDPSLCDRWARSSIAAVVTPPDAVSQLLLAIPLCLLYEVGILVAAMITPRPAPDSEYQRRGIVRSTGKEVVEGYSLGGAAVWAACRR